MDFDCLGSLILVKKMFPDYRLVRSSRIHPEAQIMYDFYEKYFDFMGAHEIAGEQIDNIIIVDTCMSGRVKEYFNNIKNLSPAIKIFDHHKTELSDIPNAEVISGNFGANTTLL